MEVLAVTSMFGSFTPARFNDIPRLAPPALLIGLLSVLATAGFGSIFSRWTFLVSSALGATGALLLSLWVARKRLLLGESIAVSLIGFVLLGTLATGSRPGIVGVQTFFDGLIGGWADLLSATAPVLPSAKLRVLPFVVAWVSALVGAELLRSVRLPALPVIGPVVGLMLTALFAAESQWIAIGQGVGFVIGALILAQLQQLIFRSADGARSVAAGDRSWVVGVLSLTATFLVVAVLSPAVGTLLGLFEDDRFDLRDFQDINWDPLTAPNPLVDLKGSFREDRAETVAFRVEVLEDGVRPTRMRVASFGSYDGQAWRVADRVNAVASFRPIDRAIPSTREETTGARSSYVVTIDQLGSHWLPSVGTPTRIEGTFPVRYNEATETLASPRELTTATTYRIEGVEQLELDDINVAALTAVNARSSIPIAPGSAIDAFTEVIRANSAGGFDEVLAIQRRTQTFFYDRDETSPGHTIAQLNDFLTESPSRGFEEQYAAAAGIVALNMGAQTRVTVGYRIADEGWEGDTATVLREDIAAWIEVKVEDLGWVPVDVTPDRRQQEPEEELGPDSREFADAEPPSQTDASNESELTPPVNSEEEPPAEEPSAPELAQTPPLAADDSTPPSTFRLPRVVVLLLVYGLLPLLLLVGPMSLVVWAKVRRRRRRNSAPVAAARVAGAWQELGDRLSEAGHRLPNRSPEEAVAILLAEPDVPVANAATQIRQLGDRVDRAAFHPEPPTAEDADGAWAECGVAVACLQENQSRSERFRSRYNPAPLLDR